MVGSLSTNGFSVNNLNQTFSRSLNLAVQLSSGLRVNKAADDVAALIVGTRQLEQRDAFNAVQSNINQAQSLLSTADSGYKNIADILDRAKQLAIQAGSDNIGNFERGLLDQEFQNLLQEVDRIAGDLRQGGNGRQIIGDDAGTSSFRTGIEINPTEDTVDVALGGASLGDLGLAGIGISTSITTRANADAAITNLDAASVQITNYRATVGAGQTRLDLANQFVTTQANNLNEAGTQQLALNVPQAVTAFQNTLNLTQQQIAVTALSNEQQRNFLGLFV